MQNDEHNKLSNKFMQKNPALSPKIKVSIKIDIQAYKSHSPPLEILMDEEYVKKMTTTTKVIPYLIVSTADTGAQVIIRGHNHLNKVGLNISCLHLTETVMDCTNATVTVPWGCSLDVSGASLL